MKQAESPACTKNSILIVAEHFQGLFCAPLAIEQEIPINISHLLSEAIWAGIYQEALFIVQAGDSAVTTATTTVTCFSSPHFLLYAHELALND